MTRCGARVLAYAALAVLTGIPRVFAAVPDAFATALAAGDTAALRSLLEATGLLAGTPRVFDLVGGPRRQFTLADYLASLEQLSAAIPDLSVEVRELTRSASAATFALTFAGTFTGTALAGHEPNGMRVHFTGIDTVFYGDERITRIETASDHLLLLRQIAMVTPVREPKAILTHETVKEFEPGTFIECMAPEPDGSLLLSILFRGEIWRLATDGSTAVFARLPGHTAGSPGFICIARDPADGTLYASFDRGIDAGVWRIAASGSGDLLATLPAGARPNGITLDGRGGLVVGDNVAGLWRVRVKTREAERWLTHRLLTRRDFIGQYPAANGVQRLGTTLWVVNSDRGLMVQIPVLANGRAGAPKVLAQRVPGDDFALDDDGTSYVTTHPFNSLLVVTRSGQSRVVADTTQGMLGPTSAAIVERDGERWVYVANDGGFFAGLPLAQQRPSIVRLKLPRVTPNAP